jgi:hypothetical protein
VVGHLNPQSPDGATGRLRGFRQGLKEAGYVEGENLAIEYRWAEGQFDRLQDAARRLIASGDVETRKRLDERAADLWSRRDRLCRQRLAQAASPRRTARALREPALARGGRPSVTARGGLAPVFAVASHDIGTEPGAPVRLWELR